jgi:hypothetical protein
LKKLAAVGAFIALAFPSSAAAGEWFYYNYVGPGENNGVCIWYPSQSACGGWNYWFCIKTHVDSGGTVLIGYENNDRIRGVYRSAGGTAQVFPSDVGMGGYLMAQDTWWSGAHAYINTHAATSVIIGCSL